METVRVQTVLVLHDIQAHLIKNFSDEINQSAPAGQAHGAGRQQAGDRNYYTGKLMQKTILSPPISFEANQNLQIVPSTRGDVLLAIPSPKPPTTHPYGVLNFLTEFRNDTLEAYLSAITLEQYGAASFLEGGLGGIDVVINNKPRYDEWRQKGETCLKEARAQQDWATANWWKGFVCGLEIADRVQRASWYDARRWEDRLLEWLPMEVIANRTRGKIA